MAEEMAGDTGKQGRFQDFLGSPSWTVDSTLANQRTTRVNARLLQHDGRDWRMTTLQNAPHRASDAAVGALRQQIWSRVTGR